LVTEWICTKCGAVTTLDVKPHPNEGGVLHDWVLGETDQKILAAKYPPEVKRTEFRGIVKPTILLITGISALLGFYGLEQGQVVNGIIFLIASCVLLGYAIATRCPSCGRWFARKTLRRELLGRSGGYQTVTRTDTTQDSRGRTTGTISRQEQVHVIHERRRHYHICRYCGFEWSRVTVSTTEG
jgi:hypothetical protein